MFGKLKRKRAAQFLLIVAVVVGLAMYFADALRSAAQRAGASAIAKAPNYGLAAKAPEADEITVPVGPPAALLSVHVVEPAAASRGTIFLLHGIRDTHAACVGWARMLSRHGYRAVLVDLRGHGRSTGDYLSYGVVESRDLAQLLDALSGRIDAKEPIGAMGISYGAAVSIQWAGSDPRVRAVVAIAPFADLRSVISPGYAPSFIPASFVRGAVDEAGQWAGFDPDAASPAVAAAKAHAAILVFHGTADRRIPIAHAERIVSAAPGHAKLVAIEGAGHDDIGNDPDGTIFKRAPAWFEEHFRRESTMFDRSR